jgi:hypothetical protein
MATRSAAMQAAIATHRPKYVPETNSIRLLLAVTLRRWPVRRSQPADLWDHSVKQALYLKTPGVTQF